MSEYLEILESNSAYEHKSALLERLAKQWKPEDGVVVQTDVLRARMLIQARENCFAHAQNPRKSSENDAAFQKARISVDNAYSAAEKELKECQAKQRNFLINPDLVIKKDRSASEMTLEQAGESEDWSRTIITTTARLQMTRGELGGLISQERMRDINFAQKELNLIAGEREYLKETSSVALEKFGPAKLDASRHLSNKQAVQHSLGRMSHFESKLDILLMKEMRKEARNEISAEKPQAGIQPTRIEEIQALLKGGTSVGSVGSRAVSVGIRS